MKRVVLICLLFLKATIVFCQIDEPFIYDIAPAHVIKEDSSGRYLQMSAKRIFFTVPAQETESWHDIEHIDAQELY